MKKMIIKKYFFIITLTANFIQFAYDAENKCYAARPLRECVVFEDLEQLLTIDVTDLDRASFPQHLKQPLTIDVTDLDRVM